MRRLRRQAGAALIALLAVVMIAVGAIVLNMISGTQAAVDREHKTAQALGRARDLLIARAAADLNRPGSLPCPDTDNDGDAESPVGFGGQCPNYVGRLPIETLEAPDLFDGDGERLWYALSDTFRDYPSAPAINSDTTGNLTVNGSPAETGVVAIVFSAGAPLAAQNRTGSGLTVISNYLEGQNATPSTPDTIYERQPMSATFNDRLLTMTPQMLLPEIEKRVAREARECLEALALTMGGRFPWAADLSDPGPDLDEVAGTRFGRLPTTLISGTWPSGTSYAGIGPSATGSPVPCLNSTTWWASWRMHLFYAVAEAYAPTSTDDCSTSTCLTVNGTSSVKAVVLVAGRALSDPSQARSSAADKSAASNYLETGPGAVNNAAGDATGLFWKAPSAVLATPQYNDKTECLHEAAGTLPCR